MFERRLTDYVFSPTVASILFILLGFIGIYVSTYVTNPYSLLLPVALITGTGIYHVVSDDLLKIDSNIPFEEYFGKLFSIVFFGLIALTIVKYANTGYQRTISVHFLTYLQYSLMLVLVLFTSKVRFVLFYLGLTGILHRMMIYYSSPIYLGNDTLKHNRKVVNIVVEGDIWVLANEKYYFAPFYHIYTAVGSLIPGIEVRHSAFLVSSLFVLISVLFVFIFIKYSWNEKVGAIGAILFTGSDFAINWGTQPQPTTLGVIFFIATVTFTILYLSERGRRLIFIVAIFMAATTFSHQVSTFILTIFLGSIFVSTAIIKLDLTRKLITLSSLVSVMFLFDAIKTKYSGPLGPDVSFLNTVLLIFKSSAANSGNRTPIELPPDLTLSYPGAESLSLFHVTGTAILLALGIIGALCWLERNDQSTHWTIGLATGIALGTIFPLVLLGPIFDIRQLLPWRWFIFIYLPLTMFAAAGLVAVARKISITKPFNRSIIPVLLILLLVLPYFALMGGNFRGSYDGPVFDNAYGAERYSVDDSEYNTIRHVDRYATLDTQIRSDERTKIILSRFYQLNADRVAFSYDSRKVVENEQFLLVERNYSRTKHARYDLLINDRFIHVYGPLPIEYINETDKNVVYTSGADQLYWVTKGSIKNGETPDT